MSSDTGPLRKWNGTMQSVVVFLLPSSFLAVFLQCKSQRMSPCFVIIYYLFPCRDGRSADTRNTFSFGHYLPKIALGALQGEAFGTGLCLV